MIIFKTAIQLTEYLQQQKAISKKIGFVPTMGALHNGHLSLIQRSINENDITVCSIFINPTQFNNQNDLISYPVMAETDIEQLVKAQCSVLFLPGRSEIYSENFQTNQYELGHLEDILEGYYRPGHFQGVCQVVDRLLEIVPANTLYLGQKDYQQCLVIKRLLDVTGRTTSVKLIIAPTIREENGLAMSSRNLRLNPQQKLAAQAISTTLFQIKNTLHQQSFIEVKEQAAKDLANKGFAVDYIEIVTADALKIATAHNQPLIALIAASIGGIRLIDNLILN